MANIERNNLFAFLSPRYSIRSEHLSKMDVKKIKISLGYKIGAVSLLLSLGLLIAYPTIFIIMGVGNNFDYLSAYGISGIIGFAAIIFTSITNFILQILCIRSKKDNVTESLSRLGSSLLFIGLSANMILSIHSDASSGLLSSGESITPALTVLAILLVVQPFFWVEAIVLNSLTIAGVLFMSFYCADKYDMQALYYYVVITIFYAFLAYIVVSILFYAETQRYCQVLRNERLYNTAMYDELTHCKNRHALREFLKENQKRWATKSVNILLIMFDIDNFKEYNDQFSHPGGDYCLINVTNAIRREFPSPNLDFFRYGGEEFLLFMEIRNVNDSSKILQQVKNCVKKQKINAPEGAPKEFVTISVGGLNIETPTDFNFDYAIKTVDEYLYKAKRSGKDTCCLNGELIK